MGASIPQLNLTEMKDEAWAYHSQVSWVKWSSREVKQGIAWDGLCYISWLNFLGWSTSNCCVFTKSMPNKSYQREDSIRSNQWWETKVGHLRVFGCTAYSHIPKDERHKLDDEARRCIFLEYSTNRKRYRLYDPNRRKIVHSLDVKFNEFVSGVEKETPTEMSRDSRVIIDCSRDDVEALEDDNS